MKVVIGLIVFVCLLGVLGYGLYRLNTHRSVSSEYDEQIIVTRHREGNITYLIFGSGNGIAVVNYTADSTEQYFMQIVPGTTDLLQSPIKPDQWTILPKTK